MNSEAIRIYEEIRTGKRSRFPRGFWVDGSNYNYNAAADITKYLVEDVLNWDDEVVKDRMCCEVFFQQKLKGMLWTLFNEEIVENISRKIFVENRLDTMMHVIYGNNATQAVKSAFKHLF